MARTTPITSLLNRMSTTSGGTSEQLTLDELLSVIAATNYVVRAAIELRGEPHARALVVDALPETRRIGRVMTRYSRIAFLEVSVQGRTLVKWIREGNAQVAGLKFKIPELQAWATSQRHPSRANWAGASFDWPILRCEARLSAPLPSQPDHGFLIAAGLPTFANTGEAIAHYLYPGQAIRGQNMPDAFLVAHIADTRCWFSHLHFTPTHVAVRLGGVHFEGARIELIGIPERQEKTVGRSGRIKLRLPAGIEPEQILIVSRGSAWLDYRLLGRTLRFENRSDTTFEPPDRSTQVALLAVQGEQQTIEYKRQLPATESERIKLARTVVAFANTQGGYLIYGVEREGASGWQIVGVDPAAANAADDLIRTIRNRVTPDPEVEIVDTPVEGRRLIAVFVAPRTRRFFALNTTPPEFYVRRQANNFPATLTEIRELAETVAERQPPRLPWQTF
jgi:hypothetical protein